MELVAELFGDSPPIEVARNQIRRLPAFLSIAL